MRSFLALFPHNSIACAATPPSPPSDDNSTLVDLTVHETLLDCCMGSIEEKAYIAPPTSDRYQPHTLLCSFDYRR
ncbi:uncharacterized protein EDB91DRAFT_1172857 [Suillus paluster]|uniref:uncharacterized protein n=1 Tax=Suillus paluster TaxID=48578 RepID=UPI001B8661BA|nr:uncharacterized protein EDB91DRAFT_1172857 [Suillus paluster]KAG1723424.1 hypothetical protein EDB91DRAFT_1172857 [Suillus paluster]